MCETVVGTGVTRDGTGGTADCSGEASDGRGKTGDCTGETGDGGDLFSLIQTITEPAAI